MERTQVVVICTSDKGFSARYDRFLLSPVSVMDIMLTVDEVSQEFAKHHGKPFKVESFKKGPQWK